MRSSFRLPHKTLSLLFGLVLLSQAGARDPTNASKATARPVPQWLRGGVVYEVFPRDFSKAGDLNAVTSRLDDLHRLGVTVLWVMPLHPIGEKFRKGVFGSPYSISNYYAIAPDYGTVDDFKRLVSEAHKRGMKLIMDLVADHTSWDSVMMAHPEFYRHDSTGKVQPPVPEWSDVAGLNYSNQELRGYMIAMMKHWVEECDVDGFRCDVASMIPTDFWEQARTELERIKPDIILLAEASKPELMVKAFDIDYSWPLLGALNEVIMDGAPAKKLQATWEDTVRQFPQGSLHLRITDDHDEPRAVARFGLRGALAASALMFTLDGVPLLYNGMEVGDATESGDPALFDKLPIFWSPKGRPPLPQIYRSLIQLRKQNAPFRNAPVQWVANSDETNVVTFVRADDKDEFLVAINFCNRPITGSVEVNHAQDFNAVRIDGVSNSASGKLPHLRLDGFGWQIYHRAVPAATTSVSLR